MARSYEELSARLAIEGACELNRTSATAEPVEHLAPESPPVGNAPLPDVILEGHPSAVQVCDECLYLDQKATIRLTLGARVLVLVVAAGIAFVEILPLRSADDSVGGFREAIACLTLSDKFSVLAALATVSIAIALATGVTGKTLQSVKDESVKNAPLRISIFREISRSWVTTFVLLSASFVSLVVTLTFESIWFTGAGADSPRQGDGAVGVVGLVLVIYLVNAIGAGFEALAQINQLDERFVQVEKGIVYRRRKLTHGLTSAKGATWWPVIWIVLMTAANIGLWPQYWGSKPSMFVVVYALLVSTLSFYSARSISRSGLHESGMTRWTTIVVAWVVGTLIAGLLMWTMLLQEAPIVDHNPRWAILGLGAVMPVFTILLSLGGAGIGPLKSVNYWELDRWSGFADQCEPDDLKARVEVSVRSAAVWLVWVFVGPVILITIIALVNWDWNAFKALVVMIPVCLVAGHTASRALVRPVHCPTLWSFCIGAVAALALGVLQYFQVMAVGSTSGAKVCLVVVVVWSLTFGELLAFGCAGRGPAKALASFYLSCEQALDQKMLKRIMREQSQLAPADLRGRRRSQRCQTPGCYAYTAT